MKVETIIICDDDGVGIDTYNEDTDGKWMRTTHMTYHEFGKLMAGRFAKGEEKDADTN